MKKKIGIAALLIAVCSLWLGFASAGEKIYSWVTDSEGNEYQCWQEGAWLYYYESEDGSTLLQYSGSETTVTLPAAFDGKPVIKILPQATNNIVNAIIPGEMAVLPEGSFSSNTNLRSVTFQNGVTEIGKNAFYGCYALEDVSFPDTLTSIGYQAFIECTSLMDVTLSPTGSCTIGENAFYGCTGLTDLTLNPNVTAIGKAAFYECVGLNTVSLPDTLTSIGSGAFTHLEGALAELEIPSSVTTLDLPIVDNECIMVVEDPSPALGLLLAQGNYANYRIEGESDTSEVTDGTTVAERVSAIVATVVKGGMSDYEKALVLHDYLTQHAQYNVGYENESTDPYHATNHEADGVLLKGTGVCESYTKAYGLLLDAVGIENDAQISDTHTWNLVKLDGEWYHVDVTWDDPTIDSQGTTLENSPRSGREGHHYFCIPDYALEGVSEHEFNGAGKPVATAYALNYDYLHGGLDSRLSNLKSAIEARLQTGETVFSLTSSDLAAFNPATADGVLDRTALTVMQDREYAGQDGTAYTVDTFTYAGTTLSLTMKAVEETPVTVSFPEGEELVLGQEIEITWALLEGYDFETASIGFQERKEDGNGNSWLKRQSIPLTGSSGTVKYTPEAGTTLLIGIVFQNENWGGSGYFVKNRTYSLTGTPIVSLVIADSSLTPDKENCTMDFAYQISGGTGSYQKLHYQIIAEPEGCVDAFYPEGEILSPDSSGTLTLQTLLPGSYLLYMDVDDGSNWHYHVNKNYTISEEDGSRDIKVHIPDTLYTKNAPQAVIWSLTGGYTPFCCNVELNFLDENGNSLTEEPFVYEDGQTSGEALLSLTEPMTLKAVFSIATQNPTGPRGDLILLDPMEIPITVEKASPRLNMIYSVNGEVLQPGDSFAFDQTLTVDWELSNVPEGWELGNDTQMGYRNNQAPGWTHSGDWLDEHTVLIGGAGSGCFTITPKTADSLLVMIHLYDPAAESYETLCMDEFTLTGCTLEPLNAVVTCDTDSIQRPGRRNDGTEIPRTVKVHYQITGGSGNYSMSLPDGAETSGINWYWLTEDGTDESLPYGTLDGPEGDLILSAPENAAGPL